jgi:Putative phage serine protease XkdF
MPYTIETNAADCKGFAVVDESGKTVACHTSRKDALNNQRALYANVPDAKRTKKDDPAATSSGPTVSDVHVTSLMGPVRIKRPALSKSADTLIAQHTALHKQTDTPSHAQLFVHHSIMEAITKAGQECDCSCGKWSEPLLINSAETDLSVLAKSENPSLDPVKAIIQSGLDNGYKFADVLQMLDIGGYMMVVRPKEIMQSPSEPTTVEDSMSKSILAKIKDLLKQVGEPSLAGSVAEGGTATFKADTPETFVPPKAVQEEAQRALAWIKDGHAGDGFTSAGRTRAGQLARGEGISRDTLARMKSFLARHEVDSQGQGYKQGEKGYPSAGRVAYAAWGGDAAKTWVDKLFRQYDLAKSYGSIETVYKADEKRFTLGPWYIPDQQDAHGEWTDTKELQNALWNYVKAGDRRIRLQHNKNVVAGEWVEAMTWPYPVTVPITKADGTSEDVTYPAGTVFMGTQWEPWAWELVKKGKLTGYSIGGKAERMLVDLPEGDSNE